MRLFAGCGAGLWALDFGLVAIGFGLSSLNILYLGAGHAAKVMSIATLAGHLWLGVLVAYRRNLWLGAGLAAAFTAINLSANHLQMTYYLAFLVGGIGHRRNGAARRWRVQRAGLDYRGCLLAGCGLAIFPMRL